MKIQVSSDLADVQRVLILLLSIGFVMGGLYILKMGYWLSIVPISGGIWIGILWFKYLRNYATVWIEGREIIYSIHKVQRQIDKDTVISAKFLNIFVRRPILVIYMDGPQQKKLCFLPCEITVPSTEGDHEISLEEYFNRTDHRCPAGMNRRDR